MGGSRPRCSPENSGRMAEEVSALSAPPPRKNPLSPARLGSLLRFISLLSPLSPIKALKDPQAQPGESRQAPLTQPSTLSTSCQPLPTGLHRHHSAPDASPLKRPNRQMGSQRAGNRRSRKRLAKLDPIAHHINSPHSLLSQLPRPFLGLSSPRPQSLANSKH